MREREGEDPDEGKEAGSRIGKVICRCPNCGYERKGSVTLPCYALRCPRCDSPMTSL